MMLVSGGLPSDPSCLRRPEDVIEVRYDGGREAWNPWFAIQSMEPCQRRSSQKGLSDTSQVYKEIMDYLWLEVQWRESCQRRSSHGKKVGHYQRLLTIHGLKYVQICRRPYSECGKSMSTRSHSGRRNLHWAPLTFSNMMQNRAIQRQNAYAARSPCA